MNEIKVGSTFYPVYNRDALTAEQLKELQSNLSSCFVYWEKGYTDGVFYKGEVFDHQGYLVADHCDESVNMLILRLTTDVFECSICGKLVEVGYEIDGCCEDCVCES